MTKDTQEDQPVQPFNTCGSCWWNVEEDGANYCTNTQILEDHYDRRISDPDPRSRVRLVADGRITTTLARTNVHNGAVFHCGSFNLTTIAGISPGTSKVDVVEKPASNKGSGAGSLLFVTIVGSLMLFGAYHVATVLWGLANG